MKRLVSQARYTLVSSVEVIKCMGLNIHSPIHILATLFNETRTQTSFNLVLRTAYSLWEDSTRM